MGKYTNLARKFREDEPQEAQPASVGRNKSVNIYSKHDVVSKGQAAGESQPTTNLRTTNLTNLIPPSSVASLRCIHGMASDECAVCSGFVRWVVVDEDRFRRMQQDPEAARREFWRTVRGGAS